MKPLPNNVDAMLDEIIELRARVALLDVLYAKARIWAATREGQRTEPMYTPEPATRRHTSRIAHLNAEGELAAAVEALG